MQRDLDLSLIDNIEFSDVEMNDYPDFSNAFISFANYAGREMTEEELDNLNENYRDYVYDKLMDCLF